MTGADPQLAIAGDFIVLRMALVDALDGNFEAAILFQRIAWRCERTGEWEASREDLQAETRLSEWKIKAAIKKLKDMGWLDSRRRSSYDPTPVWQVIWDQNGQAESRETLPHVKEDSSRTVKEESSRTSYSTRQPPVVPQGTTTSVQPSVDADPNFQQFWSAYPKKVDKKQARKAWQSEVTKAKANPDTVLAALDQYVKSLPKGSKFVKNPATWLRATEFEEAAVIEKKQPRTQKQLERMVNEWRN